MTFSTEVDRDRRRKADPETDEDGTEIKRAARRAGGKGQTGEYGSALRSVYQSTVQEDIPSEFLDLLGKLD